VARRKLTIALEPIVLGIGQPIDDDLAVTVLDAAADHLRRFGLARWSIEDVADAAGVGRTSVYRWFGSRDDLVHAVLARELRLTLLAVGAATVAVDRLEDKVVEAAVVCFGALEGSVVGHLLRIDPGAVLPLLTTGAAPLISLARAALAPHLLAAGVAADTTQAAVIAESLARLGLSFVLTRETVVPVDDPAALRTAVAALIHPLLRSVG
jgi:AcrR family transcriptional regulator